MEHATIGCSTAGDAPAPRSKRSALALRVPRPGSLSDVVLLPLLMAMVAAVTALDWFTGSSASPELFYAILILAVVWVSGPRSGILSAAMASVSEIAVNRYGPAHVDLTTQMWNSATHFAFYITICVIVIGQRRLFAERDRLATTDPMTGVLNRRAFMDVLSSEMDRARRYRRDGSLLYMDLDCLKEVNDRYGHDAGDAMIARFVSVVGGVIRSSDRLARLGGDEFAVFCPETSAPQGLRAGERIIDALNHPSSWFHPTGIDEGAAGEPVRARPVRVSIGVASIDLTTLEPATLVADADDAMYRAKRAGGQQVRAAGEDPDAGIDITHRVVLDADRGAGRHLAG